MTNSVTLREIRDLDAVYTPEGTWCDKVRASAIAETIDLGHDYCGNPCRLIGEPVLCGGSAYVLIGTDRAGAVGRVYCDLRAGTSRISVYV